MGRGIELRLQASTPQGVAHGLYGLLQEKLGFRFVHPRQTVIPRHKKWPLPFGFRWSATPRFEKRGFHLHTLHPTELAEQPNNPHYPNALDDVKEYLDWLARNGQNVVQFYLLRQTDSEAWTDHAKRILEHAHDRGIMVGIAFLIQQRAYQAIHLLRPFRSYRSSIDDSLARLFRVKWDFVTLELTMGEYLPDLGTLLPGTRDYLTTEVTGKYRTRLFYATHFIRRSKEGIPACLSCKPDPYPGTGILIHTVMNYAVSDANAPVYGNENLEFMLKRAAQEDECRETWFWPESSYWIAYDSSVPLLFITYLYARWRDMKTMEKIGVSGHLTFSSGWEWGYWLIDWSIARWSWKYEEKGVSPSAPPLSTLEDIFCHGACSKVWKEAMYLEKHYLKEKELIRYMAASTPFAEFPRPFRKSFQPGPAFSYAGNFRRGTGKELQTLLKASAELDEYAGRMETVAEQFSKNMPNLFGRTTNAQPKLLSIANELKNCLAISAVRTRHRALTIRAFLELKPNGDISHEPSVKADRFLEKAAAIRNEGLELVHAQERLYRYPVQLVAGRRNSMTAYHFGYLFPVSSLFFWEREEEQIRHRRFDPFFMNIWDFHRVLGLNSLF